MNVKPFVRPILSVVALAGVCLALATGVVEPFKQGGEGVPLGLGLIAVSKARRRWQTVRRMIKETPCLVQDIENQFPNPAQDLQALREYDRISKLDMAILLELEAAAEVRHGNLREEMEKQRQANRGKVVEKKHYPIYNLQACQGCDTVLEGFDDTTKEGLSEESPCPFCGEYQRKLLSGSHANELRIEIDISDLSEAKANALGKRLDVLLKQHEANITAVSRNGIESHGTINPPKERAEHQRANVVEQPSSMSVRVFAALPREEQERIISSDPGKKLSVSDLTDQEVEMATKTSEIDETGIVIAGPLLALKMVKDRLNLSNQQGVDLLKREIPGLEF